MKKLFERFMNNMEELKVAMDMNEEEICNRAFDLYAEVVCVSEGSCDYFDVSMGQWYPGEPPEYEVYGYGDYVNDIVATVAIMIAEYYDVTYATGKLFDLVREHITEIFPDEFLSETDFIDMALSEY